MSRLITGTLTYSNQSNRDAALGRINNALSGYTIENFTTTLGSGITTPTSTTINISIRVIADEAADGAGAAILSAAVQSNRHSSGFLSVNKVQ